MNSTIDLCYVFGAFVHGITEVNDVLLLICDYMILCIEKYCYARGGKAGVVCAEV